MFESRKILPLVLWLLLVPSMLAQNAQVTQEKSMTVPLAVNGMPVGVWSGSAVVLVENSRSAAPIVRAFDKSGREVAEFALTIPGSSLIKVHSGQFVRGFDGSFAIAGHVYTNDARGTSFVAWISADGSRQTVVRLSPYLVYTIAMASDGTIWTAGGVETPSESSYDLIRRFDRNGKLLGSMISSASLKTTDAKRFVDPASNSFLAASSTNIGWYSEAAQLFVVFALDGSEIYRVATATPAVKMMLHGLAMCANGKAYIGAKLGGSLSRDANSLGVIPVTPSSGGVPPFISLGHAVLYGCDGSSLVAYNGESSFAWYNVSGGN